jgi:hypothetical protein
VPLKRAITVVPSQGKIGYILILLKYRSECIHNEIGYLFYYVSFVVCGIGLWQKISLWQKIGLWEIKMKNIIVEKLNIY